MALGKAMTGNREDLVMCVACEKRVAELIAEHGRVLCSVCKLQEMAARTGCEAAGDETDD